MYYALPEYLHKKLLFCSSGFVVYLSEERQLVLGLVMGFSIVCKRQRAIHILTSREATKISHRKGHHQRFCM
jgi:hypothetical protein